MNFILFILLLWVGAELNAPMIWMLGLFAWFLFRPIVKLLSD